jgi:hypothetical protein
MTTLENFIIELKEKLLSINSLESLCYYFITEQNHKISELDFSNFTGEVEKVVINSFKNEYGDLELLEKIGRKLSKGRYRLNVYHYVGLYHQDILYDENPIFEKYIQTYYLNHSFKYKFLIAKVFEVEFEDKLILDLRKEVDSKDITVRLLKHLYLEETFDINKIIRNFQKNKDDLSIVDLLLLETLRDKKSVNYDKLHNKLRDDIIKMALHIQSKHKTANNSEDQYNSLFESLLKFSDYKTQPQTQLGQSSTGKTMGELDIMIFTNDDIPLSIFEAFKLKSTESKTIIKHLKKLSENYDPNGIKINYAVIYSKADDFSDLWKKYKKFVLTIDLEYKIINGQFHDVTTNYEQFAAMKIGYTEHLNRGSKVKVYHIFMDMNFK